MNLWLKRVLLLSTIGGGVVGLISVYETATRGDHSPWTLVLLGVFCIIFAFGIYAGWQLAEDHRLGIRFTRIYLALQVPFISSPFIGFGAISALGARIGLNSEGVILGYRVGSEVWISLFQGAPWGFAVNIVALSLLVLCLRLPISAAAREA